MDSPLDEGIRFFNTEKFFEAHEAWEAVWLKAKGEEKMFLHGLIQVAAAFHHLTRGNLTGFRSLLEKGGRKLEDCREVRGGIRLAGFLPQLQRWLRWSEEGARRQPGDRQRHSPRKAPPLPKIKA
ncbi:MAG: DUF309 domain-containing protein [Acidobacteria bacterium]|nr:DUF309 domain-containing protein [Acidobacteriota bacterium]